MLDHCKSQPEQAVMPRRGIPALRWWIGSMLLLSTVINYIDRQTLSLLAPYLKLQFHWTNTDYAWIIIAFRITYAIGQSGCGRMLDRLGAKLGLTITVAWYSSVSVLTSLASGLLGFAGMPPRSSVSGFPARSAPWPLRSLTAALPSAEPSHRSWCWPSIRTGDGVRPSCFPVRSDFFGW